MLWHLRKIQQRLINLQVVPNLPLLFQNQIHQMYQVLGSLSGHVHDMQPHLGLFLLKLLLLKLSLLKLPLLELFLLVPNHLKDLLNKLH